jgi:hypothetical protein
MSINLLDLLINRGLMIVSLRAFLGPYIEAQNLVVGGSGLRIGRAMVAHHQVHTAELRFGVTENWW